ncbi:MAG: PAS domain-containing sensor histidine kinase [Bacteriovoracaceae bacterium]
MKNRNDKLLAALELTNLGNWYFDSTTKQLTFSDSFIDQLVLTKNQYDYSLEQFSELILPEHRELWLKSIEKCAIEGTKFNCIISTKINNKGIYYFEVHGKGFLDDHKKIIGVTGLCQDITEKINLENELIAERNKTIQTAKMSTLGEMASGIAHELNNPLTVLSGFAFKLNKMANSEQEISKPLLIEYSDNIKAMIKRMGTIINGLRVFARDGSNQPSANVQLSKIVNDSLFLCKAQFENKKIKFEVKVDDSIIVNCREILISQVLINLLNNAYQSLKNDEKIYDKFVKLTCLEDSKWITIMIEDNGPGVPKEFQDKIFQAFFTTKKVGEGTGLGLSISKGIIESHQGELFLEQFEKLTRFVIKLPK